MHPFQYSVRQLELILVNSFPVSFYPSHCPSTGWVKGNATIKSKILFLTDQVDCNKFQK